MRKKTPASAPAGLLCFLALAAGLLLLSGCTATAPLGGQGSQPVPVTGTTPAVLPSYMVHVPGQNHGVILLVGRSTCPWCTKTKELLANMNIDYYWIDLNALDQAETAQVMDGIRMCGQTGSIPILVINGERCIIGYQEEQIRGALK